MGILRLSGKTRKGKNRIREHGRDWDLIRVQDTVLFTSKPGPWYLVKAGEDMRWVHARDDENFVVECLTG